MTSFNVPTANRVNIPATNRADEPEPGATTQAEPATARAEPDRFIGRHVLAELYDVDDAVLDDPEALRHVLRTALTDSGATVHGIHTHHFTPHGVTVLAMLSESHASIHTYPESGSAFVDVFTCGYTADPVAATRRIAAGVEAGSVHSQEIPRGELTTARRPPSSG